MVGLVVISHGDFASGLLDAMRMIAGEQKQVEFVSLKESESPDDVYKKLISVVQSTDSGDGVLIMVDLFGATPFNVALRAYLELDRQIEIICGVNLPMVLEVILNRENYDLSSVLKCAHEAGINSLSPIPDGIRKI